MKYINIIMFISICTTMYSQNIINPSKQELDSIKNKLEIIFKKDQTFRKIYKEAEAKLDSLEIEYFWEVVEIQDKNLEKEVTLIIDKYGWLGISQVGHLANTTLWAVLQHGSIASKNKYAPLLKASVLKRESQPTHYARLIDRMLINSNKPQLYGTQYKYDKNNNAIIFTIKDPKNIDKRRKEIGLNSMIEFTKARKIKWNQN